MRVLVLSALPMLTSCAILPRKAEPPVQPRIEWIAPGCPPQFGACLTPTDSAALAAYLRTSRQWMRSHDAPR